MATEEPISATRALEVADLEQVILLAAKPPTERIVGALELARTLLGMEFSYLTEMKEDEQLLRGVAGDADGFDMHTGDGYPAEGSYDRRMLLGSIPNIVQDVAANVELRDLALTSQSDIGSYVGVPVHRYSGALYGTLSAISHSANSELGDRDVRVLELLGAVVTGGLEQRAIELENERLRKEIGGLTDELDAAEEDRRLSGIITSGEFTRAE
jgi:GAF domain-containing protein